MPAKTTKANIFLFHGDDSYSSSIKVREWVDIFIEKHSPQGVIRIDALEESDKLKDFFNNQKGSAGLFSIKQLVVIKNFFSQKASETEFLSDWLQERSADLFLVFWESGAVKKTLKLYKKLASLESKGESKIYTFEIPVGRQLNEFIRKYCTKKDIDISSSAQETLAKFLGRDLSEGGFRSEKPVYDLWETVNALEKLSVYAGKRTIERKDVEALVSPKISDNVFLFTEALGKKDAQKARAIMERLFYGDQSTADAKGKVINLLGAVSFQFRSLLHLALSKKEGGSGGDLGWNPYRLRANENLLRNLSVGEIVATIKNLGRLDRQLKSSAISDKAVLSQLFLQIL